MGLGLLIRWQLHALRQWDQLSSLRIDYLVANSNFTANRIWKYWKRPAEVIHPPVNVNRFEWNNPREDFYLSVCRLVPNKRVDLLVRAFNRLKLPLIVVGDGVEKEYLKKGYTTKAIRMIIKIARQKKVKKLKAGVVEVNYGSIKFLYCTY